MRDNGTHCGVMTPRRNEWGMLLQKAQNLEDLTTGSLLARSRGPHESKCMGADVAQPKVSMGVGACLAAERACEPNPISCGLKMRGAKQSVLLWKAQLCIPILHHIKASYLVSLRAYFKAI